MSSVWKVCGVWEGRVDIHYRFTFHYEGDTVVFRNIGHHDILDKKTVAVKIKQLAQCALRADDLTLRILVQEFLRDTPILKDVPRPQTKNRRVLAVAAGLLELFALRSGQAAPEWTQSIGALPGPVFLAHEAARMKRLRQLCLDESPEPLKKRNLYATPNYLLFA